MMKPIASFLAALATAALPLAMMSAAGASTLAVPLHSVSGSHESGVATLTETPAGTMVSVALKGYPAAPTAQALHIHPGACPDPQPQPKYPLTSAIGGESKTLIKGVTIASLVGKYSINVHKSTKDFSYVSCGNIR